MLVATIETRLWEREDSQIDFATGNIFLHVGGGGGGGGVGVSHKNISQILATESIFSSRKITGKNLVSKEEYYR